jgi:enamine deaminase RidA (YjgF/YER057c/UK114 family)
MGLELPDFARTGYYGSDIGTMKSHHLAGTTLTLSGHIPMQADGTLLHAGIVGRDVTVEQGYEAARLTAINVLAGIRLAVGSLDRVASIVKTLNFVRADFDFTDVPKVSNGCSDLLVEVFGEAGRAPRATIGITSLHGGACFETWVTVEITPG